MYIYTTLVLWLVSLVAAEFDAQLHAKYETLPRDQFIEYFNSQKFTYNITNHPHLHGKLFSGIVIRKNNTFPVIKHLPETYKDLPENFDPRKKWPHCVTMNEIYDQHNGTDMCGSCWTFGTATTINDRMCIHLNKVVRLAEQDFECLSDHVCYGGSPGYAFDFWKSTGLVTQECKPYNTYELRKGECHKTCVNKDINYEKDKHFGEKVYSVSSDEDDIRAELFNNGPIEAAIDVYTDFIHYSGGIYEHKYGKMEGGHSLKIIGYGVENGVKYWLGANSWTTAWGEKGFFRIKRYAKDVWLENELLTAIPKN